MEEKKMSKSSRQKRREKERERERERSPNIEATEVDNYNNEVEACKPDEVDKVKKKAKLLRKKKMKNAMVNKYEVGKVDELYNKVEGDFEKQNGSNVDRENNERKLRKKRRKSEKTKKAGPDKIGELCKVEDCSKEDNGKSKRVHKKRKEDRLSSRKDEQSPVKIGVPEQTAVYEISSGDEDCCRGMKKWITEYHQSRPGLKILQQRIDDFITAFETQEEQARKEREALAAEGGWTVVVHHKGRKKTTDAESGVTVGSVAQAAVLENMSKKKSKDVGLDFYRFQKREAQRNEIMALQSKFEQDKKRIQQLRAARKFRPY
ncbi:hypothetical protein U1Q18_038839 [Sarracenia purpurea var. burkii]